MGSAWFAAVAALFSIIAAYFAWKASVMIETAKPTSERCQYRTAVEIARPYPEPIVDVPSETAHNSVQQPRFRRAGIAEMRRQAENATLKPITEAEKRVAANARAMEG